MRARTSTTTTVVILSVLLGIALGNNPSIAGANEKEQEVVAVFEVADTTLSAAISGCGLCQQTGLCDHAFKGNLGQFCLTLASGLPCCCPQDAQCVANVYSCRCRRAIQSHINSGQPAVKVVTHTSTTTSSGTKSISLFTLFAMLLCVCCCLCAVRRKNHRDRDDDERFNQPVHASYANYQQYGATSESAQPAYAYPYQPSAPPAYYESPVMVESPHRSGGTGFLAGAAGAVAGLAAGMMVGSAFGGGGNRQQETTTTTTTSYFDGDSGFNNNTTSGFEFGGDTGGDDGGDFGGDS